MRAVTRAVLTTLLLIPLVACGPRINLSDADDQLNVGVNMARRDLWREAAFRFEKAVALNPADAMARNNLAVAYEGMGEFEKARDQYTEALRLDRSNQYVQRNYSRFVEFYQRNRAEAEAASQAGAEPVEEVDEAESEPVTPPVSVDPGPTPPEVPPPTAQPDPPEPPVTTPPDSNDPTEVTL